MLFPLFVFACMSKPPQAPVLKKSQKPQGTGNVENGGDLPKNNEEPSGNSNQPPGETPTKPDPNQETPKVEPIPEITRDKGEAAAKQLEFLSSLTSNKYIIGQFTPPGGDAYRWTRFFGRITKSEPGVWSSKIEDESGKIAERTALFTEVGLQIQRGVMIQLDWEPCSPADTSKCDLTTRLSDEQWEAMFQSGSAIQKTWFARLDKLASYLEPIQSNPLVLRMLPRMNSNANWWAGKTGKQGSAALYELTHHYLYEKLGLTQILFAWDVDSFDSNLQDFLPRKQSFDIATVSLGKTPPTEQNTTDFLTLAEEKPIAIGSIKDKIGQELTAANSPWVYIVSFDTDITLYHTRQEIKALYKSDRVLTNRNKPGKP